MAQKNTTLEKLNHRIKNPTPGGHAERLKNKGLDKALKKLGEEVVELIIACKSEDKKEIIEETADVLYHLLIALDLKNIEQEDIWSALEKRLVSNTKKLETKSTKIP